MKLKNKTKIIITSVVAIIAIAIVFSSKGSKKSEEVVREIHATRGNIEILVSTTGTVLPRNRLEIVPTVAGRIDKILVNEGDNVKAGQTLAWMSSTDRASLIDAARAQGAQAVKYWENTYKAIPIIAPINGTLIVRDIEPGQTVTTSTVALVISDTLIIKAQVDETDIGRVKEGQTATVSLDAHPEISVRGRVSHIYYESVTVNNVTMYYVEIKLDRIPEVFRSGMSANINITEKSKRNTLLVPPEAVATDGTSQFIYLKTANAEKIDKRKITTGLSNEQNIEIVSGITEEDTIIIKSKNFVMPSSDSAKTGTSPFMPNDTRRRPK